MKIAIVYDWIDRWGGVERLLLELHHMFPSADFFTSSVDLKKAPWAKKLTIKTSFLQHLPPIIRTSRIASLFFYPFAFESLSFDSYDLVISVTSSFAKSVITKPLTKHLCILLTPSRYLFLYSHPFEKGIWSLLFRPYIRFLRKWDKIVAQRPDKIISISHTVSRRCRIHYNRESGVIYPPFDLDYWKEIKNKLPSQPNIIPQKWEGYYLVVSRLEPYKKIDIIIQAFNSISSHKLVIVGRGSLLTKLKESSRNNILFLQDLDDVQIAKLYAGAKALIMPQEEDFGYTAVEAQFFHCPVISYGRGGATETIIEGRTGIFFPEQSTSSFMATLERFDKISYNFKHNTQILGEAQAQRFAKSNFEKNIKIIIKNFAPEE